MRLTDLLTAQRIKIPLQAVSREDAIKELIELLRDQVNDMEQAYRAILEREKIMTTGVGNGIAIPHCKHNSCPNFAVALGISDQEIEFQSIDQRKVKIVFLLIGPENSPGIHIKLLSRISRLMSNESLRQRITTSKNNIEVLSIIGEEENNLFEID